MAEKQPRKVVTLEARTGGGRPKAPLERRKMLSDNPHHHRKGEPDVEMSVELSMDDIPAEPIKSLSKYERECWDFIARTQIGASQSKWIYRSDCAYVLGTCFLYGRAMELRDEINADRKANGSHLDEEGRLNPKIKLETSIYTKYLASLTALGLVPTRRQVTVSKPKEESDDGLLH